MAQVLIAFRGGGGGGLTEKFFFTHRRGQGDSKATIAKTIIVTS